VADPADAAAQALQIAVKGSVNTVDGATISLTAESICCHGDTPRAVEIAAAVRSALTDAGVALAAP
jgi:UPF0271 protein